MQNQPLPTVIVIRHDYEVESIPEEELIRNEYEIALGKAYCRQFLLATVDNESTVTNQNHE